MILFRKYYKIANNKIETKHELIDKIFDEYSKTEAKSKKVYHFGMRYGTAFAAVLVLCVAVAVYPKISKLNEEPITIEPKEKINSSAENILAEDTSQNTVDQVMINANTGEVTEIKPNATIKEKVTVEESDFKYTESHDSTANFDAEVSVARIAEPDASAFEAPFSELKSVTEEEIKLAVDVLTEKLGKADETTGNVYSFEIAGKLETDNSNYYLGRWRWLVDDHSSLLCEFMLSDDLNELYECRVYDNTVSWTKANNMFE